MTKPLQEVVVTGSRIIQSSANSQQPLSIIDRATIDKTGLASIGELLQQVTAGGKALNAKFNSSGNFGYPADGGGIGAGSAQVDLRNLGSKRVLVLVDGIRWVNESSASGVSGAADLNTIPMSIIDRIEVLEDGASAIYGSDAIAGVVNIITRKQFEGVELNGYFGEYEFGGATTDASITLGGSGERFSGMFVASYYDQEGIDSGEWEQSSFPQPNAGLAAGSSGIPQGRYVFCDPARPASTYGSCTPARQSSTTSRSTTAPRRRCGTRPILPTGTYHNFSGADRFNYAPFNLLLTPSQRKSMFARMSFEVADNVSLNVKGLFNNRQSTNRAAPEPIFVGPNAGTGGLADTISISALNPFNPFGIDLDCRAATSAVSRAARRSRARACSSRMSTPGTSTWASKAPSVKRQPLPLGSELRELGKQRRSRHSRTATTSRRSSIALGDPAICALIPGCTPLDLFGGQGRPFTPGDDRLHPHHADRLVASKRCSWCQRQRHRRPVRHR